MYCHARLKGGRVEYAACKLPLSTRDGRVVVGGECRTVVSLPRLEVGVPYAKTTVEVNLGGCRLGASIESGVVTVYLGVPGEACLEFLDETLARIVGSRVESDERTPLVSRYIAGVVNADMVFVVLDTPSFKLEYSVTRLADNASELTVTMMNCDDTCIEVPVQDSTLTSILARGTPPAYTSSMLATARKLLDLLRLVATLKQGTTQQ